MTIHLLWQNLVGCIMTAILVIIAFRVEPADPEDREAYNAISLVFFVYMITMALFLLWR